MILQILRAVFILLVAAVAALYVLNFQNASQVDFPHVVLMMTLAVGIAAVIIAVDVLTTRKKLTALSGVMLGLLAGLLVAWAMSFPVDLVRLLVTPPDGVTQKSFQNLLEGVKIFIGLVTCYMGISLVLQTKDDFRFVIPYIEFAKEYRGNRPILLDTSVIIDGRVLDLVETHIFQANMIVPRFVLNELQAIADSQDKLRRARGRRGLEVLQKLQDHPIARVTIQEMDGDGSTVDQKLVSVAQRDRSRIMTNDFNLAKVATLAKIEVVNLNDIAKALRPVVLPGEVMKVRIIRPGETPGQGVGYLEDGTMVVVEGARQYQGAEIDLIVTSSIQTSAGRMIFGRTANAGPEGHYESRRTGDTPLPSNVGSHGGLGLQRPSAPGPGSHGSGAGLNSNAHTGSGAGLGSANHTGSGAGLAPNHGAGGTPGTGAGIDTGSGAGLAPMPSGTGSHPGLVDQTQAGLSNPGAATGRGTDPGLDSAGRPRPSPVGRNPRRH